MEERGAHTVYRISYRGEDAPMVMGPTSNKLELVPGIFDPKYFCTAQQLEEAEDGSYKELDKFWLFFINSGRAPKKVGIPWATSGWNTFNSLSSQQRYDYVIAALTHGNIVAGVDEEGRETKRMMFTEPLLQQIKSEAVLNPDGEWKWMPKHMQLPDLITPRDDNGEPAVKAAAAAAGASGSNKKKPAVQAKPKIDRIKEKDSHDVSAMLQKKAQQIKREPPPPIAAAAAASSSSSKKLTIKRETGDSSAVLDFFAASPEPSATGPPALFSTASTLESTKELLAELIDMRHRRLVKMGYEDTAGDEINKSFTFLDEKLTMVMESDDNFENKCKAFDAATEKIKGLQLLLIALPLFNVEAARMMREKLAQM